MRAQEKNDRRRAADKGRQAPVERRTDQRECEKGLEKGLDPIQEAEVSSWHRGRTRKEWSKGWAESPFDARGE